jgi:hypothetical protein
MPESEHLKAVIKRLLARRDPTAQLLYEVEMLHEEGVHALTAILKDPLLQPRKQLRALQGLAYASKHLGPNFRAEVANAAIALCSAPDIGVRSRAAHMAIMSLSLLKSLAGPDAERHRRDLTPHVEAAVRDASLLGLRQPMDRFVAEFLSRGQ